MCPRRDAGSDALDLVTLAYVTYQDIRSIRSFDEKTVVAIKAPPETRLEVPDPQEVGGGGVGPHPRGRAEANVLRKHILGF